MNTTELVIDELIRAALEWHQVQADAELLRPGSHETHIISIASRRTKACDRLRKATNRAVAFRVKGLPEQRRATNVEEQRKD